jgi:molybdopterin-guanine dinucleotide biosynthesis protein A
VKAPHVLVLAGDMTAASPAVASLLQQAARGGSRVFVAVAPHGRLQPLLALWPTQLLESSVRRVLDQQRHAATALYDGVDVVHVTVPDQSLRDVDVPEDLRSDQ